MQTILVFLRENSDWLFGGGGLVAAVIAILALVQRYSRSRKPSDHATANLAEGERSVAGDNPEATIATGDKDTVLVNRRKKR